MKRFGTVLLIILYLGVGALVHHMAIGPEFQYTSMHSWGVLLAWPVLASYYILMSLLAGFGVLAIVLGASEKEPWVIVGGIVALVLGLGGGWAGFL